MQLFAMFAAMTTILAGSWVALRLLGVWRRTRQAPECLIGIGTSDFQCLQ